MTAVKMLQLYRQYTCVKCRHQILAKAEFDKSNLITPPNKCANPEGCGSSNLITSKEVDPEYCKDYQEIKLQEIVSRLEAGNIPNSMWVALDDDLVDSCKPGDSITVCGIVKERWGPLSLGRKMEIELVMKAIHIQINNYNGVTLSALDNAEATAMFPGFWDSYANKPLAARDMIVKSICPQLFGLHLVKLAVAVVLAGGSKTEDATTGIRLRSEPHILLVGDPGTGKSQILRFASKLVPRSVLTTGIGSTAAGLTAAAVMESGEWQLEGGALVLSDGGICCIDELNSMKEHDRISIHEAMEQQTISIAKASIVCKLNTRCSILAATNPKGNLSSNRSLNMNIGFASPLLSRFDLIMILKDQVNSEVDSLLTDYILNRQNDIGDVTTTNISWTIDTLKSYFAFIKKIHPILSKDSSRILSGYYQARRQKNCRNQSRTTVRLLDSLIRLSQGHARLMYHTQVEIVDAVMAVMLVETAIVEESSFFCLQFNVQGDFPCSPMQNYIQLANVVLKKLKLEDILAKEIRSVNRKLESKCLRISEQSKTIIENGSKESRFFKLADVITNDMIEFNVGEASSSILQKSNTFGSEHQNELTKTHGLSQKQKTANDCQKNIADDLEALNFVPSINDDFKIDYSDLVDLQNECETSNNEDNKKPEKKLELKTENTKTQLDDRAAERKELFNKFRFKSRENKKTESALTPQLKMIFEDNEEQNLNSDL